MLSPFRRWLHRIDLFFVRVAAWFGQLFIPHLHRLGLLPGDEQVRLIADIHYGPDKRQAIDVYLPQAPAPGPLPFVCYMHGGGWMVGDRKLATIPGRKLAARGIPVVAVGYRLAPEVTLTEQLEDLHVALRLIRERAAGWGLDPDCFAFAGESAGAHLSVRFAQGIEEELPAPAAVVGIYGLYDFVRWENTNLFIKYLGAPFLFDLLFGDEPPEEVQRRMNAIAPLRSRETSVLLIHGSSDSLTPWDQSEQLGAYLKEQGTNVTLRTYEWMEHAYTYLPFDWIDGVRESYDHIFEFLDSELLSQKKKAA